MDKELLSRAAFQILMDARAHCFAIDEYDLDTDDILARATVAVSKEFKQYPSPVEYSIETTVRLMPKVEKPYCDFYVIATTPTGKKYKMVHSCTENE